MDRILVYPGNIPLDTDILNTNRNSMVALGYLAQAISAPAPLSMDLHARPRRRPR